MKMHQRGVSLQDVAARPGVSATTISQVLDPVARTRVRPVARNGVRSASDELRRVLNGLAGSLRTRCSHVMAMVGDEVAVMPHGMGFARGCAGHHLKAALL